MASVAATGRRARGLAIRAVTDRGQLRAFLEMDRLLAAYAICDLEEREFGRTHWGAAFRFGYLKVPAEDFMQIARAMGAEKGIASASRPG